jgi:glycosyltransferase involved in cell wall biosynthesis
MTTLMRTELQFRRASPAISPVLLVTPWYRPTIGGVVEIADRLLRLLDGAGIITHLLVCDDEAPRKRIEADSTIKNVWRHYIPSYVFDRLALKPLIATLTRGPFACWRLHRFIRRHQIRTVVLIYPCAYAWPFLLLRYTMGVHLVTSWHGNDILQYGKYSIPLRLLLRLLLLASDAIAMQADHLAHNAQELFPGRRLPIHLIQGCVDVNHFVPPPRSVTRTDAQPTLIHVSNFNPKKRVLDIIEAFSRASLAPNSRLVMVGTGPYLEPAVQYARELGVQDRIEFAGAKVDVRPYLWNADLFIMASDEESGPLALLEAMACGLPWVSTPWGVAATLGSGECGLIVPSRSPRTLAAAISELINDPARRHAMGIQARARAEAEFGEKKYLDRHITVLQELENGHSKVSRQIRTPFGRSSIGLPKGGRYSR